MALSQKRTKRTLRKRRAPRSTRPKALHTREMLKRIDEMIRELQVMREQLSITPKPPQPGGLTQQLFGALGHGTWDEYDMDLDWKRFGEWELR